MLSDISHNKRTNIICFHLDGVPRIRQFIETKSRVEITKELGSREWEMCLMGRVYGMMKKILEMGCGYAYITLGVF